MKPVKIPVCSSSLKTTYWDIQETNVLYVSSFVLYFCSRSVWPLSLLAFRGAVHSLSLKRQHVEISDTFLEEMVIGKIPERKNECNSTQIQDGQFLRLEHCYRRHVKPKKQHEILALGQVCNHRSF